MSRLSSLALALLTPVHAEVQVYLMHSHDGYKQHMHSHGGHHMRGHPQMNQAARRVTAAESEAMRSVEESCSVDIVTLCSHDDGLFANDPMMSWIMSPMMHPPSLLFEGHDHIHQVLNQMMDSALASSEAEPSEGVEPPKQAEAEESPVDRVFDTMVSSFAEHVSSESASADEEEERVQVDPVDLAKRVIDFGHQALQEDIPEDRRRLARRLTSVDAEMIVRNNQYPRLPLPFGCHKNRCLWKHFEMGHVSHGCAAALINFKTIVQQEKLQQEVNNYHKLEQQQDFFLAMVFLYGILAFGTMMLLIRRFRKQGHHDRFRLKRRILQAIYSNPSLKAAVEEQLNEDLGVVPPLPPPALLSMSPEGRSRIKSWRRCRLVRLVGFSLLMFLAIIQPFTTMFLLCIIMGVRFFHLWCCARKPIEDCTCCCCGGSTADVQNGTVSDAQACCTCCKGTGVCAPACASCCGGKGDCDCDCHSDCCCSGSVEAIAVEDCTCCCCGGSTADVRNGTVSEAQACCNCCRGTGKCSPSCASCCGGKGSCDGDCCTSDGCCDVEVTRRRVRSAKHVAYEGVPVQVV